MNGYKTAVILACCGSLVLAAGCGENKTEAASAAPLTASQASPPLSTVPTPAAPAKTEDALIVTGPIIVEHQVDIAAQRDGIVSRITSDAGERVKAGTALAQMDDRQLAANLAAARAKTRSIAADLKNWQSEAEVLKADYGRAQKLWDLGLISEEQLQHAKYKAESDQWDIKRVSETLNTAHEEERALELELEKTRVIAPFNGVIARRYVREGQSVVKGDRLFWVTGEGPLRMRFTLPEKFVGRLKKGQELPLTSPDVPEEKHRARVVEVSPVVDPASGTIEVLVELIGVPGALKPGMTADAAISIPR